MLTKCSCRDELFTQSPTWKIHFADRVISLNSPVRRGDMSFVSAKACVCSKSPSINRHQGNELATSQLNRARSNLPPHSLLDYCLLELRAFSWGRVCDQGSGKKGVTSPSSPPLGLPLLLPLCCALYLLDIPSLHQGILTLHSDDPEKVWLHREEKN